MTLADVGLKPGDRVRWRPREGARWTEGTVATRERDGSIGLRDHAGKARSLPLERLEVATTGPRGARTWEAATERAARTEQLGMFE
jgi:hypothetical protein